MRHLNELISIIIPVYNVEKYVTETIESVIKQSYSDIEILLINDGSTDSSLAIIKEIEKSDSRVKVINKKNEGLSSAREIGIQQAKGKYFVTIDSDDLLDPDYIKELYKTIVDAKADIALCARKTFDKNGNQETVLLNNVESILNIDKKVLDEQYNYIAAEYQMSDSWNKMYRREFVICSDVHFNTPKMYNGTDMLFNYCLLMHCPKIATVNMPLYYYRLTENSRVRRKNKHLEVGFRYILNQLLEENKKCINSYKLENQIYASYLSMLKYATQDLSYEIRNLKFEDQVKEYGTILETMPQIARNRKRLIIHASRKEMKLFAVLLLKRDARKIALFYRLRSLIRKQK